MNLKFCIDYQTIYGQDMVLNIVNASDKGGEYISEYRMHTNQLVPKSWDLLNSQSVCLLNQ